MCCFAKKKKKGGFIFSSRYTPLTPKRRIVVGSSWKNWLNIGEKMTAIVKVSHPESSVTKNYWAVGGGQCGGGKALDDSR